MHCTCSTPVDDGYVAKSASESNGQQFCVGNATLAEAPHLAPQRRSARVSAVESVVQAIVGARRRREEMWIRS